jgi:hypothetical protein
VSVHDGLYSIELRGEREVYPLTRSDMNYGDVCRMLSDLTGYKAGYIAKEFIAGIKIQERRPVKLAMLHDGEHPHFIVVRTA